MSKTSRSILVSLCGTGAIALMALSSIAQARCSIFSFSVNDYGKDGPARDAQSLLDKNIARWAAANGVKKYSTGKKTVTCELFLDFGVFDEYTCKADANVCWGGNVPAPEKGSVPSTETRGSKPAKPKA